MNPMAESMKCYINNNMISTQLPLWAAASLASGPMTATVDDAVSFSGNGGGLPCSPFFSKTAPSTATRLASSRSSAVSNFPTEALMLTYGFSKSPAAYERA
eukprot:SAG31_NODE_1455_length_8278_cov_2.514366_2_plen_101_part_00